MYTRTAIKRKFIPKVEKTVVDMLQLENSDVLNETKTAYVWLLETTVIELFSCRTADDAMTDKLACLTSRIRGVAAIAYFNFL